MKRELTNEQFQTLLQDPVISRFELENSWSDLIYRGENVNIIEGEELSVYADVFIGFPESLEIYDLKQKNIDLFVKQIIDDECNEYQFSTEQERIFENHFRKNVIENDLVFSVFDKPIHNYEYPIF